MICPNCGKDAGESRFCPDCGTRLEAAANAPETTAALNEPGGPAEAPTAANEPAVPAKTPAAANEPAGPPETPAAANEPAAPVPQPQPVGGSYAYYPASAPVAPAAKKPKSKKLLFGILCGFAALVLLIGVSSAAKKNALTDAEKAAVKSLVRSIDALPDDAGEKDEKRVNELMKSYDALQKKQQKKVKNYKKLTKAEKTINKKKVQAVEDAINSIGTVTVDSGDAILTAKAKYEDLPDELKSEIKSADKLTQAQATYENLCAEQVIKLIDGLGEITLESKGKLDKVEASYAALSDESKKLVTNYDKYTAANKKYGELEEAEKKRVEAERKKKFKAALSGLKHHSDSIRGLTWYEPNSWPKYINSRSYFLPYICCNSQTGEFVAMNIRANYTGDDWVFWKKITVNVDGKNYYLSANYFDINRDNDYGDVWETYDFNELQFDVDMLRAIAKSKKTVVRFEGDHYYKDAVITDSDKQGIKQILAAYDLVQ